jgi:hypothetical protein
MTGDVISLQPPVSEAAPAFNSSQYGAPPTQAGIGSGSAASMPVLYPLPCRLVAIHCASITNTPALCSRRSLHTAARGRRRAPSPPRQATARRPRHSRRPRPPHHPATAPRLRRHQRAMAPRPRRSRHPRPPHRPVLATAPRLRHSRRPRPPQLRLQATARRPPRSRRPRPQHRYQRAMVHPPRRFRRPRPPHRPVHAMARRRHHPHPRPLALDR